MTITYEKGDLLKSDCNIMMHQCNCMRIMGAGIAYQFARTWPEISEVDRLDERTPQERLGHFTKADVGEDKEITVYNLYGQFGIAGHGQRATNYTALENALYEMREDLIKKDPSLSSFKIGGPRMGAGLGGGDWSVIADIIDAVFGLKQIFIYDL